MRFFVLLLSLLLSLSTKAQTLAPGSYIPPTKEELVARRKEIMAAINETEKQLEAIKNDKQATLGQLRALQNKLAERQKLIGNINDELDDIDKDIKVSSREVMTLKQKLELLNIRYAQSIRYAYSTRSSYDMLAFLFSSHDFNDAMRRMKYLKKFRDFRKQQVDQIRITQGQLKVKIGTLNQEKQQKDQLLNSQVQQKQVLVNETNQTNQVIQDLKGKEKDLMKEIEKNRQTTARINKAIQTMIEREMAKAAKAAEEAAKKTAAANTGKPANAATKGNESGGVAVNSVPTSTHKSSGEAVSLMLTPTDVALASSFEGNKGRMYWPVEKGYIIGHFGTHPHPLEPQVMIENNGVNIQTSPNAAVRAVFDGTVTNIFSTVGSNKVIMIKHGNYFTVYSGLQSASVSVGQEVTTKQVLGQIGTNDEDIPVLDFEIWKSNGSKKGQMKLNPEQWIGKAH
jgi:septal ring factor EnvC (AmiA/AmiB activator)